MKKGFTLIELLAVIVILAIIAVIAVPIVIDIIEDTKINSIKTSASMYLKSAELFISNSNLNNKKINPGTYPITKDGNICIGIIEESICNGEIINIEIKGSKPNSGQIIINEKGNVKIEYLEIDGYTYYKDNDEYVVVKGKKTSLSSDNGVITINGSKTEELSNYRIYGNSYQEVNIQGKNLFRGINQQLTANGVTLTYDETDGTFELNGTSTGPYSFEIVVVGNNYGDFNVGDYYTLSSHYVSGEITGRAWVFVKDSYTNNNYFSHKVGQDAFTKAYEGAGYITRMAINVPYIDMVYKNYKFKVQFEKGDSATSFEKFSSNTPSSEFPSEIQSVGNLVTDSTHEHYGEYEIPIRVTGKNLFNFNNKSSLGQKGSYNEDNQIFTIKSPGILARVYTFKEPIPAGSNVSCTLKMLEGEFGKGSLGVGGYHFGGKASFQGAVFTGNINEDLTGKVFTKETTSTTDTITDLIVYVDGSHKITTPIKFQVQFEFGSPTQYEPYKEEIYSIYLDKPLRCVEDVCDYIDFESGKVVRYIEEIDNTGTKTIEESFVVLSKPIIENIELPKIKLHEGVSNIFVETNLKPSKFIVNCY